MSDPSVSDNARRIAENAKYGKVNIDNLAKANDALKQSYKAAAVEATLFNMAVTIGISVAVSKFMELVNWVTKLHDTYQDNTKQQAEKAKQRVSNIDSELSNIKELTAKYKELASKSNLDFESKLEIKDIQNQITQLVGNQADNLDLVNGKLDEELSKLNKIYETQEKDTTSAYRNAYGTAVRNVESKQYGDWDWLQKLANDLGGTKGAGILIKDAYSESTFNSTVQLINDTFKQLGIEEANATATFNDFVLKLPDKIGDRINALDAAIKAMESQPDYQDNKIYQKLNEFRDEMYSTISDAQKATINLLDRLEKDKIDKNYGNSIKSVEDYIKYRDKIIKSISSDTDVKDAIAKGLISEDTIKQRVDTYLSTLEGFSIYYQQWQNQTKNTTDKVVTQANLFDELMEKKGTDKNPSFVESIEKDVEKFQKLEDALVKFESGTLKDSEKISLFKTFPQLTAYANNLGEGIRNVISSMRSDIVSQFAEQMESFKNANATPEEIAQLEAYQKTILNIVDTVDSVKNALTSIGNVFKDLDSVIKDYNENQYFSLESLEKLGQNGQRYLSYLSYENGQLKINEEAYKKLVLAQIDEIETKATLQATTDLQSLTDETAAKEYLAKVNIDLAQSQLTAAQAAFQYQLALKLAQGGNVAKAAQKVADNLNTLRNIFANARNQVDDYAAAMLGATSATEKKAKASEKAKTALEKEQHALEHSKKALEEEKKALENNKDEYEKAQKAIEDLIKWTQNYIKQINEDKIKALEKEKDKFDELIDKQKESLQTEKDLHEYEKSVGEKTSAVASSALKTAITSLDDSSAGKKAYKQAQEEYKNSQTDMQEFLYNHEIEVREKELDKLKEDTDKRYDEQINKLQEYLNNEVQLYRDACHMIDTDNGTLYNKLLNYALTYTTTGRVEFDRMWTLAQNAMEKYNVASVGTMQFMDELKGRIYDVDDAIETVSKNIEAYENRINDVKEKLDDLKDAAVEAKNALDDVNTTPLPQPTHQPTPQPNPQPQNSQPTYRYKYTGMDGKVWTTTAKNFSEAIEYFHKNVKSMFFLDNSIDRIRLNIKRYASGTRSAKSGIAQINENGLETLMRKTPDGDFVIMNQDDKVYTKKQTDNLYDFSGNPEQFLAKLAEKGLSPLSQEELANLGLWGDMSQVVTDNEILSTIKANDFLKQYNTKGNVPDNQILNNINIYNTINGDVTPQMLRLLEQKEKDIIDKSIGKSVRATQDMLLRGRNLR